MERIIPILKSETYCGFYITVTKMKNNDFFSYSVYLLRGSSAITHKTNFATAEKAMQAAKTIIDNGKIGSEYDEDFDTIQHEYCDTANDWPLYINDYENI